MASAMGRLAGLAAVFSMCAAQAFAQGAPFSQLSPRAQAALAARAPPELSPCRLAAPPEPYDKKYNRLNSSGFLDVKLVNDSVVASIRDVQMIMNHLQSRTEQVRCEQDNTRALLSRLGANAADCPLAPPTPYAEKNALRVASGYPDITAVIAAAIQYRYNAIDLFGDVQARLQRLACGEVQLARLTATLVEERAPQTRIGPSMPQPCDRPTASPSYVRNHLHMNASGIMDYRMAINTIGRTQEDAERWLDDLQGRIEQIGCEQSKVRTQVKALIRAQVASNEGFREPSTARPPILNASPSEPSPTAPVRRSGRGLGAGAFAAREPPRAVLAVQPDQPPAAPAQPPVDPDCENFAPEPSFVRDIRIWGCSSAEDCGVYDEAAMKLVAEIRHDTEEDGDDLQVRLRRLVCQQQNINAQLIYVFSLLR